jgi:hypothetical protein
MQESTSLGRRSLDASGGVLPAMVNSVRPCESRCMMRRGACPPGSALNCVTCQEMEDTN